MTARAVACQEICCGSVILPRMRCKAVKKVRRTTEYGNSAKAVGCVAEGVFAAATRLHSG